MHRARRGALAFALVLIALPFMGCSSQRILVPPRVDLLGYRSIGMLRFESNAEGKLQEYTTQRFLQTLQSAQPGVRVLELGSQQEILGAVERDRLDFESIRAIGDEFGLDALIIGEMEVTEVKPKVSLASGLSSLGVNADVEATLTARLFEAGAGATIWSRSTRAKKTVAHVGMSAGSVDFGAGDPDEAYGELVDGLVYQVTHDFRASYRKQ